MTFAFTSSDCQGSKTLDAMENVRTFRMAPADAERRPAASDRIRDIYLFTYLFVCLFVYWLFTYLFIDLCILYIYIYYTTHMLDTYRLYPLHLYIRYMNTWYMLDMIWLQDGKSMGWPQKSDTGRKLMIVPTVTNTSSRKNAQPSVPHCACCTTSTVGILCAVLIHGPWEPYGLVTGHSTLIHLVWSWDLWMPAELR